MGWNAEARNTVGGFHSFPVKYGIKYGQKLSVRREVENFQLFEVEGQGDKTSTGFRVASLIFVSYFWSLTNRV